MRGRRLCILWVMVILAVLSISHGPARADTNPITNGDLERLAPNGFPADWGTVGEEVGITSDAHSGKVAFRLVRKATTAAVETGINRDWEPDSGKQGAMLDRLKGGIVFWYKAVSQAKPQTLTVQIVPMSARPYEDTGSAREAFVVPDGDIGDGKWHRSAIKYDFTGNDRVKWLHIAPRVLGPGELLLDDFSWVEKVGPIIQIREAKLIESQDAPGRQATISIELKNTGDEASPADTVTVDAPAGLTASPASSAVPAINPDDTRKLEVTLRGARYSAGEIRLALANAAVSRSLQLEVGAVLDRLAVEKFILAPRSSTTFRAIVLNTGSVILPNIEGTADGRHVTVAAPRRKTVAEIPPGRKATLEWRISPTVEDPQASVSARVELPSGAVTQNAAIVSVVPGQATSLTDGVRTLAVRRTGRGYGLCELRVKSKTGERVLAKMPYLARLVFSTPDGTRYERPVYAGRVQRAKGALTFTSTFADAQKATWRFTATFRLTPRHRFAATYALTVDKPRSILAFDGPMLYVGEGTGAVRRDGLFPGLEWLVAGEESSSALDLEADHPDRIRYVPHPNKVTIPLMSLRTDDGVAALLWDPHQKWDGSRDRPAAVFASPDRFEQRESHLIGLMLPSVPDFIAENKREAAHPYPLKPGAKLTLTATLLAEPAQPDALVAQDAWVEDFGIPEPMPYPHGSLENEITFSARAYLDSLWLPDKRMWLPFKGGPGIWMIPSRNPTYAYDLLMASMLASDPQTRDACKQRFDLLMADGPLAPAADDLGFDYGRVDLSLAGLAAGAAARIDSQGPDGAWRFDADLKDQGVFKGLDYHELGQDNAAELGTCARAAYEILLVARMTGDKEIYGAGVRALKFMERFSVPRAAQVWEVPVHTPDILAAADAVDAYLEAYRIDGDKRWLNDAVKWARAGLPFVYLWNTSNYPFMRYASIPVLGASWFKWSWIGRAVQWNGLRYAYAVLKLSQYDSSLPWTRIAQGLTVSGMYQQATESPDVALWPDSISLIDASKSGWIFAPQQILKNVYYVMGRPNEPQTVAVPTGGSAIRLTSGGRVANASFTGDELRFTLAYPSGKVGTTAVVGVTTPRAVFVDGAEVPAVADVTAAKGASYRYVPAMNLVCIRIVADGQHEVLITGIAPRLAELLPQPRSEVAFEFDATPEGWQAANDLAPFDISDGILSTQATGGDPYMIRGRMRFEGDSVSAVVVRMSVTGGSGGQFYWSTADQPGYAEARVAHFEVIPDGQFHEYRIAVGDHPLWKGHTITGTRLDPMNGAPGAQIRIDWIRGM